jgi:hypothetical protein
MARTAREKRILQVLGAVVAVAVLVVGFKVLTGHKSSNEATSASGGSTTVTTPAPSPSTSPSTKPKQEELTFTGVDPFEPLVTSQSSGTEAAPTVAPAGSGTTSTSGSSAVVGGKTVTLLDIFTESGLAKVQVDVDGTVYTAATGDNFTGDYTLVSISDPCANFSYQTTSFQLCLSSPSGS